MNAFHFSDTPQRRHRVHRQPGSDQVVVDGKHVAVQALGGGRFRALLDGRPQQLHAVPDGDAVLVQWRGRAWRIERIDATRANAAAAGSEAGVSHAPMPGVVVSLQAAAGQRVSEGEALLVIESMKLQMTITAACSGTVQALPVAAGQTFQRGAVLAQVKPDEEAR
ncbi:MAG: acetyl-CoA carboxylase biotin carboxyl carrier protein subunit [Proteobacteria bacterium]|nr:acetyl-CoA carboxylase biotin carboxyl carrier protein subunit [Pseudomonadota bacterium]